MSSSLLPLASILHNVEHQNNLSLSAIKGKISIPIPSAYKAVLGKTQTISEKLLIQITASYLPQRQKS